MINPPCVQVLQSEPSGGDGKDNDCDALIDEEFCDGTGKCVQTDINQTLKGFSGLCR